MWLDDLDLAITALHEVCPTYVFTKIVPAGAGIVFYTSHFSRVFWARDGQIIERFEDGRIEFLRNFPL